MQACSDLALVVLVLVGVRRVRRVTVVQFCVAICLLRSHFVRELLYQ